MILLLRVTQVIDAAVGPSQNTNLDKRAPNGGKHLCPEQKTGLDLHVVAELHVLSKSDRLVVGDVTVSLEKHHGQWLTRDHVADDELGDHV